MSTEIRPMTTDDLPAVTKLTAELGYADQAAGVAARFPALAKDSDHGLFVALDDAGAVVGFIHVLARHALHAEAAAQVLAMAVAGARRRRGVGSRLLARAEEWAAERGLATVMLYSADRRDDAHGFYETRGYEPKAGVRRYDKAVAAPVKGRKA